MDKNVETLGAVQLDHVYTDGECFVRPIGWLGETSLVYEHVKVYQTNTGFQFYYRARKLKGRKVHATTLDRFAELYHDPSREELLKTTE